MIKFVDKIDMNIEYNRVSLGTLQFKYLGNKEYFVDAYVGENIYRQHLRTKEEAEYIFDLISVKDTIDSDLKEIGLRLENTPDYVIDKFNNIKKFITKHIQCKN